MYSNFIKPGLDKFTAIVVLLLLLPVFLLVLVFLIIANSGDPFFTQIRPGKNGQLFTILKFKTMNDKKDVHGVLLPDEDRLTAIGKFIRKTSLDELPQLLNVIKGEMSFVGPRPLLPEYLELYSDEQARRHEVKPGITGWAQVNGRNAISWKRKFELDVYYVDNQCFILDLKILLKTIEKVLKRSDVTDGITQTTTYFNGSN